MAVSYPPSQAAGDANEGVTVASASSSPGITVEILLQTGARATFEFKDSTTSVGTVKQAILEQWPADFGPSVDTPDRLRLLYLGSFLDDRSTLESAKLTNARNIVHLVIRPSTMELQREADLDKKATSSKGCCLIS